MRLQDCFAALTRWVDKGVWAEIGSVLIRCCAGLDDVNWSWPSAAGIMGKVRHRRIKSAKTPRIEAACFPGAALNARSLSMAKAIY